MAEEIRTYFPQPNEDQKTIDQKAQSRQQAMEQVRMQAGRAGGGSPDETGGDLSDDDMFSKYGVQP
jgi:hypothetical protein